MSFLEEQEKFYSANTIVATEQFAALTGAITRRRLDVISSHLAPGSSLLEVGPGSGDVILALERRGYRTAAVEHSEVLAERLRRQSRMPIYGGDFVNLDDMDGVFDAYCSFHVIEHVVDFQTHLAKAQRCIRPGGLAFIATPNAGGWEQRLPFALSPNNDSSHFQLFSAKGLAFYMASTGWDVVEVQTPSYTLSWVRVLTKVLRRMRREDEELTGGSYAVRSGGWASRLLLSGFSTASAPLRRVQEIFGSGNEVFLVGRRRAL